MNEEEQIYEEMKQKLNMMDKSGVMYYIELFCNKIRSICGRPDFPKELNYMCIEFAKKSYVYYKKLDNGGSNETLVATSASDNGQDVKFGIRETITADDVDINKFISKNRAEISKYAYMR